mgnify:CR=1 FL=1
MRRRRRGALARLPALLLVLVLLLVAFTAERRMAPVLAAYARKQAEILGVDAVAHAVRHAIAEQVRYQDLIVVDRDEAGRVTFMQVNTVLMSRILADVEEQVQDALRDLTGTTFAVPLGLLLGSDLLAAYGPAITARVLSLGSAEVSFEQAFQTAGVNQTRHTIYLEAKARLRVLVPLLSEETIVRTRVPVVETVIVGPVPDQYLNLDWLFPSLPPRS